MEEAAQTAANSEKAVSAAAENADEVVNNEVFEKKNYADKAEVLARIKEIAASEENPDKNEINYLKTIFYKLHNAEKEAERNAFVENGGAAEDFHPQTDEIEEAFKAEMAAIKEKRHNLFVEMEEEKQANLKRKLEIIEEIKGMATSPDQANKSYQEFKKLQQEWKEIKNVPATDAAELWRNYQLYVEQFYDLLKLNNEAREYDFKKNLEIKTNICEMTEKLAEEEDVVSAFHQLQELHQQYREIGPVAKELRDEIWARFKAASTVINKRHQDHFESLRAQENENLEKKTALCEKIEEICKAERANVSDWEKDTKKIIEIQNEWRTIGFAPQKMNVKIFDRFRKTCDEFFASKSEFFKNIKEEFAENIKKKEELIKAALELKDSTDWKTTSDKLIKLQADWKKIGYTPHKVGDRLWKEFNEACNFYFNARKEANKDTRSKERENLDRKKDVIARLKALAESENDNIQEEMHKLIEEFNSIGFVPFKEKDKIFKEYHEILDKIHEEFNVNVARKHLDNFKNNLKNIAGNGANALDNERTRLVRRLDGLKQDIQNYENNMGFFRVSNKKGNKLVDEMTRKIQKLRDDMELVKEKIRAIDEEEEN